MSINSNYDKQNIIDILYKNRFQNYKVNRLLDAFERPEGYQDLSFDGQRIICKIGHGHEPFTIDLETLSTSKKLPTFSRIWHSFKSRAYNERYRFRISQLVHLSGAFDNLKKPISESEVPRPLKKLSLDTHPELKVKPSGWGKNEIGPFTFSGKSTIVRFPPKAGWIFIILNQNTHLYGIDKKGFNNLTNEILKCTFELACGKYDRKQKDRIQRCKAKFEQLSKYTAQNKDPYYSQFCEEVIQNCLALLDYELEIVSNFEKPLKPFDAILKDTLPPCAVCPGSPEFKIIFRKGNELSLDRESLSQHIEMFKHFNEVASDVLDLSTIIPDLSDDAIKFLSLYFEKGGLSKNDLQELQESELLQFFDLARDLGIFRLEALLGKEVSDRLIGGTWKDSGLIWQRKGIQDALQPFVDLVTE